MKFSRGLKVTAASLTLLGAAVTGAHADTADNRLVIGGTKASEDWIVQLSFNSYDQRGTFGCTGEQLNDEWVLTAKHCTDGSYNMQVYQSNDQLNRGEPVYADKLYNAPSGDIALIHLEEKAPLDSYPELDFSYEPTVGDRGDIFGYGNGAWSQPTTTLRTASVKVIGDSYDAYWGDAVHLRGINGASNHGDSGGPLVIDGKVVAVCSTGDEADPGANINAQSNYALLSQSADWIESTTGISYDADDAEPVETEPDVTEPNEEPVAEDPSTLPAEEPATEDPADEKPAEEPVVDTKDGWDWVWDSEDGWIIESWSSWSSWSTSYDRAA
ncbi:S1 family peptidase [Rothia aerolata]|uniref:Peptidase S1 domain-containing protein n=1 Tax=Rothia aerolata TaxID=1812262 RepID=A0A917J097_9MICC|nr:S1 family peptidase [Rothia aerolata]GGH66835.1 hypothetical protein GCM10007359_21360 [Rothia aerolata]